jgi:SAM-dependent methyltransferase
MRENDYLHMYSEEESHWWFDGMRSIVLSLLPPSALPRESRVLDAGCGTGYNLGWLRDLYGAHAVGLDCYAKALALTRARGEQELIRADASLLPFRSEAFDLVTSFDVLTHIQQEDSRLRALREFHRVLRPGGRVLVRVAAYEWLRSSHDEEILTYHRYSREELCAAIAKAGFERERVTFANFLLFPAAAAWRLLKKARLAPAGSDVHSGTRGGNWTNSLLRSLLKLEASILRKPATELPFGLSLVVVARKRPTS